MIMPSIDYPIVIKSDLPFSTLFSSSTYNFVLVFKPLCNIGPPFRTIGGDKFDNCVVFLQKTIKLSDLQLIAKAYVRWLSFFVGG